MIELINANTLTIPLAAQSVHMIAFSPPYWGLRSYQTGENKHAELGSEPLHDCLGWARGENCGACFVCHLRQVAAECWRVLRDDGVMWVNLGDSYAGSWGAMSHELDGKAKRTGTNARPVTSMLGIGLKPKDLVGIPWRVALALQADGWYLRSDIIWSKPNPMPESVTDRPTKAHEYVFLLAKNQRYFWDADAVREEGSVESGWYRQREQGRGAGTKIYGNNHDNSKTLRNDAARVLTNPAGRNARTVWTIATAPYSGSHFATWPPALVEKMVKAGTSERGACPKCGKQWARVVEAIRENYTNRQDRITATGGAITGGVGKNFPDTTTKTTGWKPACTCDAGDPIPAIVLDPFAGSGTTLMVARKLGRSAVGLDLSYTYLHDNARERLMLDALEEWESGKKAETSLEGLPMFLAVQHERNIFESI